MAKEKGRTLVIVESPAKAKTISRFLGPDYSVQASFGHVRDLPESAKEIPPAKKKLAWARLGVNVEKGFEPLYVIPGRKKKYVDKLKTAMESATALLLATDEDREGESISWHVLQILKPREGFPVSRIVFHEVTPEAIEEALRNPRQLDARLVSAQEARRVLDRLYGYSLSPVLWKRIAPGLSAGRVQSVAVRLVVLRERERIRFVSAEYWDIEAKVESGGVVFDATLQSVDGQRLAEGKSFDPATGKLKDPTRLLLGEDDAKRLAAAAGDARPWTVASVEAHEEQQRPSAPFTTSTLQQEANRKLRFPSKRTMQIAQKLYEGVDLDGQRVGLITYMRTDSTSLSQRAIDQLRAEIERSYGKEYLPDKPNKYKTKTKNAQEAHEAIRPTDAARRPADVKPYLDSDEFALYDLIWKKTIACQMLPARFERSSATITTTAAAKELAFSSSGKRILFPGFLRAYVEGSDDPDAELGDRENLLPPLKRGNHVKPQSVSAAPHATKPPPRYTEASLVKKLEEEGVGRPSTYAAIISTIQDRGYVTKSGAELVPTFTAFCVTELLETGFEDLVDLAFTARMEDGLDDISMGKLAAKELLSAFYFGGKGTPGIVKRVESTEISYPSLLIGNHPDTGEPIVAKVGRYGPYVQRGEGGPENTANIPVTVSPADLSLDKALELLEKKGTANEAIARDPATGRQIYLRTGRFGDYLELEQTETELDAKTKPRRVTLPPGLTPQTVTADVAMKLIQLPRTVGVHPESGEEVSAAIGRYGPFVKMGSEFRSVSGWEAACDITLEEAVDLFKQPKAGRQKGKAPAAVIAQFEAVKLKILDGRYGPYVTDGKTNATIPKGVNPTSLTQEAAMALIEAKKKK